MITQYGIRAKHGSVTSIDALQAALEAVGIEVVSIQYQGFAPQKYWVQFNWDSPKVPQHLKNVGPSTTFVSISSAIEDDEGIKSALMLELKDLWPERTDIEVVGYTKV